MKCPQCEKEFTPTGRRGSTPQKYCSSRCRALASKARIAAQKESERRREEFLRVLMSKTLSDWIREAAECNLDYGTYRALRYMGKTYDELKADADKRPVAAHHRNPKHML